MKNVVIVMIVMWIIIFSEIGRNDTNLDDDGDDNVHHTDDGNYVVEDQNLHYSDDSDDDNVENAHK